MLSKILLIAIPFFCFQNASAQLNVGLKAYYKFNGNFNDASGNGNHGAGQNAIGFTTDKFGNSNAAVYFDGLNDWILINASPSISMSKSMSLVFKIKPAQDIVSMLATKSDVTGAGGVQNIQYQAAFNISSVGSTGFFFNTMHDGSCAAATAGDVLTTGVKVDTGKWYCVIFTFDNGVKKIYVDGALAASVTVTGKPVNNRLDSCTLGPLKLGYWWTSDPAYYKGVMDEVRVYDRALNTMEIDSLCTDTTAFIIQPFTDTLACINDTLKVAYSVTSTFRIGNTFSIQLSDASGSFASPTIIGTATAVGPGIINCVIPSSVPAGTNYKLRIVASSPSYTSSGISESIEIKVLPANLFATANTPLCIGNTLKLSATTTSSGISYSWTGPGGYMAAIQNPSISNIQLTASGDYIVKAGNGVCYSYDIVTVIVNTPPTDINATATTPICEPDAAHFDCTNSTLGSTYTWTGPNGFTSTSQKSTLLITNTSLSGRYIVSATLNGCTVFDTVFLVVNPSPGDITILNNSPVCINDTMRLNAINDSNNVIYTWSGPNGFTSAYNSVIIPGFSKTKTGKYTVTVSKGECKKSASIDATLIDPYFDLGDNQTLCKGETVILKVGVNNASFLWQDGSKSGEYTIFRPGKYWVETTTKCGIISDTLSIEYEECECRPFIPTAFTPNNDGRNDKLGSYIDCQISEYTFKVFNRFGQAVFISNNSQEKWDGSFNGQPAEVGTYYYLLQVKGPRNKDFQFKGDITLIR